MLTLFWDMEVRFWLISLQSIKQLTDFHMFGPMKEDLHSMKKSLTRYKIVKDAFSDGIKKNLRNAGTGALKSIGITLKNNTNSVSVYLK
jgi:hypothetical protein